MSTSQKTRRDVGQGLRDSEGEWLIYGDWKVEEPEGVRPVRATAYVTVGRRKRRLQLTRAGCETGDALAPLQALGIEVPHTKAARLRIWTAVLALGHTEPFQRPTAFELAEAPPPEPSVNLIALSHNVTWQAEDDADGAAGLFILQGKGEQARRHYLITGRVRLVEIQAPASKTPEESRQALAFQLSARIIIEVSLGPDESVRLEGTREEWEDGAAYAPLAALELTTPASRSERGSVAAVLFELGRVEIAWATLDPHRRTVVPTLGWRELPYGSGRWVFVSPDGVTDRIGRVDDAEAFRRGIPSVICEGVDPRASARLSRVPIAGDTLGGTLDALEALLSFDGEDEHPFMAAALGAGLRVSRRPTVGERNPGTARTSIELYGPSGTLKTARQNAVARFISGAGYGYDTAPDRSRDATARGRELVTATLAYHAYLDFDHSLSPEHPDFRFEQEERIRTAYSVGDGEPGRIVSDRNGVLRRRPDRGGLQLRSGEFDMRRYSIAHGQQGADFRVLTLYAGDGGTQSREHRERVSRRVFGELVDTIDALREDRRRWQAAHEPDEWAEVCERVDTLAERYIDAAQDRLPGLREHGRIRAHALYVVGGWLDLVEYLVLDQDWSRELALALVTPALNRFLAWLSDDAMSLARAHHESAGGATPTERTTIAIVQAITTALRAGDAHLRAGENATPCRLAGLAPSECGLREDATGTLYPIGGGGVPLYVLERQGALAVTPANLAALCRDDLRLHAFQSERALSDQLAEADLLLGRTGDRHTARPYIDGRRTRVLMLRLDRVFCDREPSAAAGGESHSGPSVELDADGGAATQDDLGRELEALFPGSEWETAPPDAEQIRRASDQAPIASPPAQPDPESGLAPRASQTSRRRNRSTRDERPMRIGALDAHGLSVEGSDIEEMEISGGVEELVALMLDHDLRDLALHPTALDRFGLPTQAPQEDEETPAFLTPGTVRGSQVRVTLDGRGMACVSWRPTGATYRDWREIHIPAYGPGDPFAEAPDARELCAALTAFRDAMGQFSYAHSPQGVATRLLRLGSNGRIGESRPEEFMRTLEPAYQWMRPLTDIERAHAYVHAYDVNAQYLAAMSSLYVGLGTPERLIGHAAAQAWGKGVPGYWHTTLNGAGEALPPVWAGNPDWHHTSTIDLAFERDETVEISEAWIWPERRRHLDPFYKRLRDARQQLQGRRDPAGRMALAAVKRAYASAHGVLNMLPAEGASSDLYRPDWSDGIRAQARCNLHRALAKLERPPFAVEIDAIYLTSGEPDPVKAAPAGLVLDSAKPGKFKPAGTAPLAELVELIAAGRLGLFTRRFRECKSNG